MAAIKKFSWVKRPSTWEYAQAWRQQRSNMVQRFLSEGENAAASFANAQINQSSGLAALSAQASILRAQKEIAAVQSAFRSQVDLKI